jgi:hypothetical protein
MQKINRVNCALGLPGSTPVAFIEYGAQAAIDRQLEPGLSGLAT